MLCLDEKEAGSIPIKREMRGNKFTIYEVERNAPELPPRKAWDPAHLTNLALIFAMLSAAILVALFW